MTVKIVTGAPCAGKTTYVREHAEDGEVIIDFDAIAKAIGAKDYMPTGVIRSTAYDMRATGIEDVLRNGNGWIIHTSPSAEAVSRYERAGAEFIHLDTDMETCLERAKERPEGTEEAIREYFANREEKGASNVLERNYEVSLKEAPSDVPGIIAYASTFDRIPDAYGDVVAKGAFAKSIQAIKDSGNNLPLLYGHVMDDPANIIGTVTDLKEDDHGLLIHADFDMENPMAQQVHRSVLSKAITKLSFAFTVHDQAPVTLEDGTKANELRELEIYEVSLVVVPANPRAQVIAAKEGEPEMKMSEDILAVDTETEPEIEAKTEEPDGAKAEEPMVEETVEETPTETKSTQESENQMENIIETIGGAAPVAEKSMRDILAETFRGVDAKSRFSVSTPDIKAFIGTPQWLPSVSRNVAGLGPDSSLADLFGQETISGNAYTFVQLSGDDDPEVVAEGAEKPDVTPERAVKTIPLTKVAGYIQESDELIEDADWLVSAIETRGIRRLRFTRDDYTMTALIQTTGVRQDTVAAIDEAAILTAISEVKSATGYDADAVILNPQDYVAMITAALSAQHTLFGPDYKTILGVPVVVTNVINNGLAIVGAFKDGATLVQKGGIRVEATNSDQDDFIHNLVKIRIEQRLALAVREPGAFVYIEKSI